MYTWISDLTYCRWERYFRETRHQLCSRFASRFISHPRSLLREEDYRFYGRVGGRTVTSQHDRGGRSWRGVRNSCYINSTDAPEASCGCLPRIPHTFFNNPAQRPVSVPSGIVPHKSRIGKHHRAKHETIPSRRAGTKNKTLSIDAAILRCEWVDEVVRHCGYISEEISPCNTWRNVARVAPRSRVSRCTRVQSDS